MSGGCGREGKGRQVGSSGQRGDARAAQGAADTRDRAVRERGPWRLGRARKLGLVGCCGGRSGPCAGLAERERNWAGRVEGEEGRELGQGNWVGLGFGFLDLGLIFFLFYLPNHSNSNQTN